MDKETVTLLISLVGASAWLAPFVYEKFSKVKLVGKVISCISLDSITMTNNDSGKVVGAGTFYLYKLSISSLGRNFYPKDLKIKVRYDDGKLYDGRVFVPRNINTNYNGVPHKVSPPRNLLFPNVCIFQKDSAQHLYIPFLVDRASKGEVEKVHFNFIDFKGISSEIEIDFTEIDDGLLVFEEILEPM